ncbi:MAG: hypothetical protein ACRDTT_12630 [Pseudonocardiaceae bacterium]
MRDHSLFATRVDAVEQTLGLLGRTRAPAAGTPVGDADAMPGLDRVSRAALP